MGAAGALFHGEGQVGKVHDREKELYYEVGQMVESGLPGVEVLAVELTGPDRFTVYIDHPSGVDHRLCERVTDLLRPYLREFAVDVSSPGIERPLRKPAHFTRAEGRRVALRTSDQIGGRTRFRGELLGAGERTVTVSTGTEGKVDIPYDQIVRANLIDKG
jgi:ribosome maturation factor RimP